MALIVLLMALLAVPFQQGQSHTSLNTAYLEKLPPVWLSSKSTRSSGPKVQQHISVCVLEAIVLWHRLFSGVVGEWPDENKMLSFKVNRWMDYPILYTRGILMHRYDLYLWCTPKTQELQLLQGLNYTCRASAVLWLLFDISGVKLYSK